jgi:type IV pilus assembly protein PilC
MIYEFNAYKEDKQVFTGTITAISEKMAEDALYRAGYKYVLNLKPKPAPRSLAKTLPTFYGVKTTDVIEFSRQLATFLDSGSSLRSALDLLRDQSEKASVKAMISGIAANLEQGVSFSQAIKEQSAIFPYSYWQIVQSSEKAGDLSRGLKQISDYLEQRQQINNKIRRTLAYPVFVLVLAIGVVVLLVTTVLPPIIKLFTSLNADLPPATRVALSLVNFITNYKFQMLLVILVVILVFWGLSRVPRGRLLLDSWILRMPVIGPIVIQNSMGHFCRTASMLMSAGLPLPAIMDISIKSVGSNRIVMQSFVTLKERLMQGEGLTNSISKDKLFPKMMARMIATGEQTGTLDGALATLATYYEEHANKKLQSLIALIEPTLTLAIGIGIAFIMISIVVPIYSILGQVH